MGCAVDPLVIAREARDNVAWPFEFCVCLSVCLYKVMTKRKTCSAAVKAEAHKLTFGKRRFSDPILERNDCRSG